MTHISREVECVIFHHGKTQIIKVENILKMAWGQRRGFRTLMVVILKA